MTGINVSKTNDGINIDTSKGKFPISEMTSKVEEFFWLLLMDSSEFTNEQSEKTFYKIYDYIKEYDRILYSPISNICYQCFVTYESNKQVDIFGSLVSNIEKVSRYPGTLKYKKRIKQAETEGNKAEVQLLQDTAKAIVKIWDHVNLAQNQYNVLSQTDDEYRRKFDKLMSPVQDRMNNEMKNISFRMGELSKSMSEQLLTLVGIFTALAFLLFGGISSLENIFSEIEKVSLLKLIVLGCIWGVCLVNLIFVFLFCVSKMTKLSFASVDRKGVSIFRKYPIFWWTNYIIISILVSSSFLYLLFENGLMDWFLRKISENTSTFFFIGTLFLVFGAIYIAKNLANKTKD